MTVTPLRPAVPVMRLLCPAKINLHLRVGPCREDGFHPLLSWMCTVGLFDTLTLERTDHSEGRGAAGLSGARAMGPPVGVEPTGVDPPDRRTAPPGETGKLAGAVAVRRDAVGRNPVRLALECEPAGLPCDERNLVARVAAAWEAPGPSVAHLRAKLVKRIPVGAGLGGGSSDAARMIQALDYLYPGGSGAGSGVGGTADLVSFAARFGSDVPFFLAGPSSACAGRGEIVRPVPRPGPRWALLVLPDLMMPTPDVYRRFDAMGLGRSEDVEREPDWSQWAALDAEALLPKLVNDLEAPAFSLRPELGELRGGVEKTLGRVVRMSGSGSSLFTLFDAEGEAGEAVDRLGRLAGVPGMAPGRVEAVELAPAIRDDLAGSAG